MAWHVNKWRNSKWAARASAAVLACALALPALAAELVMVEEPGCIWCARWNEEIAPAYPKTQEGRFAPLRRVDISDLTGDIDKKRRVGFTPTFLVIENDAELARMEGYPGADFFWPLLNKLLTDNTTFKGAPE